MSMLLQATEAVAETTEKAQTMGLGELFLAGGWLMWPLLALGGLTIFIFCERFWAIKQASVMDVNFMNRIRDLIYEGKIAAAVQLCRSSSTPISHMIEKGIERIGRPLSDVNTSIENVANLEADMRVLAEQLVAEGAEEDIVRLEIEKLVRAYDPCLSCSVH